MPKMTKAQSRRMLNAIASKAQRLWILSSDSTSTSAYLTTADVVAIEKIVSRSLKRLG